MTTPVSAATPASAMNPTTTATERLKPSHHISQIPPTSANGSESMTIIVSANERKLRYSSRKMISSVTGTTIFRRAAVRHRDQNIAGDGLGVTAQIAGIAHVDAEPLASFHRRGDGLTAERGPDDVLNVLNHDAIAGQCGAIRRHLEIVPTERAFRIGRRCPGHGLEN